MGNSYTLDTLIRDHGLQGSDIYLLDLIPLIEVIWADNQNQEPELKLLYQFAIEHTAKINNAASGTEVISADAVNGFLDRFAHQRPDQALLRDLRQIALERSTAHADLEHVQARHRTILQYCIDIAAACVAQYPYERHERVMEQEKALLLELMQAYHIDPNRPATTA